MNISGLNNIKQNFSSNAPIYHVYARRKDGKINELSSSELIGPTLALVRRINNPKTSEAAFFKENVADFAATPIATSSIMGRNDLKKKHVIFGEDAIMANIIREDCYRKENMTSEEAKDIIHTSLIDPLAKKIRKARFLGDKQGEQIGIVLYTDEVRSGYNKLVGIQLSSIDGRIYAQQGQIYKTQKAENKKANEQLPHTSIKETPQKEKFEENGTLFDLNEYTNKESWYPEPPIKIKKSRKK